MGSVWDWRAIGRDAATSTKSSGLGLSARCHWMVLDGNRSGESSNLDSPTESLVCGLDRPIAEREVAIEVSINAQGKTGIEFLLPLTRTRNPTRIGVEGMNGAVG